MVHRGQLAQVGYPNLIGLEPEYFTALTKTYHAMNQR